MCVMAFSGHLANAATELMKLDHEEPQLTEPYLSKQKKLMVSLCVRFAWWENIFMIGLFIHVGNDLLSDMMKKRTLKLWNGIRNEIIENVSL